MVVRELFAVVSVVHVARPEILSVHGTEPMCGIRVLSISALVDIIGVCNVDGVASKSVIRMTIERCDIFEGLQVRVRLGFSRYHVPKDSLHFIFFTSLIPNLVILSFLALLVVSPCISSEMSGSRRTDTKIRCLRTSGRDTPLVVRSTRFYSSLSVFDLMETGRFTCEMN